MATLRKGHSCWAIVPDSNRKLYFKRVVLARAVVDNPNPPGSPVRLTTTQIEAEDAEVGCQYMFDLFGRVFEPPLITRDHGYIGSLRR